MNYIRAAEKIGLLHKLIQEERTGNPEILAKRLDISRATLYRLIDDLKSYDAPVCYSRESQTFYYSEDFELSFPSVINDEELKIINGGIHFFSSVSNLRRKNDIFVLQACKIKKYY